MTNEPVAMTDTEMVSVLSESLYPGAKPHSIMMVLNYCRAAGLDPMLKPVHIVPMYDRASGSMRDVVMPGIGHYRIQASRSGQFAGVTEPEFGPDVTETIGGAETTYPAWCRVVVKRMMASNHVASFAAIERWKENYAVKGGASKSVAPNAMWARRPYAQLAKCAEAQALRKAFPEFGAAPAAEEMEGKVFADIERDIGAADELKPSVADRVAVATGRAPPLTENPGTINAVLHAIKAASTHADMRVVAERCAKIEDLAEKGLARAAYSARMAELKAAAKQVDATMTFAQVADAIGAATNAEMLAIAVDLIRRVADEGQRAELREMAYELGQAAQS